METSEHPEQRHRQPGRRTSDATAYAGAAAFEVVDEEVREIAVAIRNVQLGWKRWVAFAAVVGTIISAVIGTLIWLGWTNTSPNERFVMHDSTMRASVRAVNTDVASLNSRVQNVEETVDLMSYLLCVQIRRTDPAAVPPKCNENSIRRLAPK